MSHKAYAFRWTAFEGDALHDILFTALLTGESGELVQYIEAHRDVLKDPYEGDPLSENWRDLLGNRDVHEYGDFALTRFYDPVEDWGIWDQWRAIDNLLSKADQPALLGAPFGPPGAYFDPGRLGSYFQTPRQVVKSLVRVRRFNLPELEAYRQKSLKRFEDLLAECAENASGLYVTF